MTTVDTHAIVRAALDIVKPQFRLPLNHGHHGIKHWVRVWSNAEYLCDRFGIDPTVPCWFAFLHDSQRMNEDSDPMHGARAALFARHWLHGRLSAYDLNMLCEALVGHSKGYLSARLHVRVCWDADRLDLGRVGIRPRPERLCTSVAREPAVIERAWYRSIR